MSMMILLTCFSFFGLVHFWSVLTADCLETKGKK